MQRQHKTPHTMESEIITLLRTDDMVVAEDIQRLLEESHIYTLLLSDNPAASAFSAYSGIRPMESITIQINKADHPQAIEILKGGPYAELLGDSCQY